MKTHTVKRLFPYFARHGGTLAAVIMLYIIATLSQLALPFVMQSVIDEGINKLNFDATLVCCLIMLGIAVAGLAARVAAAYYNTLLVAKIGADLRRDVFAKVNSLTLTDFARFSTGGLITRSSEDVQMMQNFLSGVIYTAVSMPVMFLGGTILAGLVNIWFAAVLLLALPVILFIVLKVGDKMVPRWRAADEYIDKQQTIMKERLSGVMVTRAYGRDDYEHERTAKATRAMADNLIKSNVTMGFVTPVGVLLLNIASLVILYLAAHSVIPAGAAITSGEIVAVFQYVGIGANGILILSFNILFLPQLKTNISRIFEVMAIETTAEPDDSGAPLLGGGIRAEKLGYNYGGSEVPAIADIDIEIEAGQTVAFIGGTGSGKSTLIKILLGFMRPTAGKLFLDGRDASGLSGAFMRANVFCMMQRPAFFAGTMADNVRMCGQELSDQEVAAALEAASLGDFIRSKPDGIAYAVEQGGKNLSGGQKQRLAIARTVAKEAAVYIFDDSFSALDYATEVKIRAALRARLKGKTQLIVTQRVSSARNADRIYVLAEGRLVGGGVHEELMQSCEIYREIYRSQTGGEL